MDRATCERLDLEALEPGVLHRLRVGLIQDGAGSTLSVPVIVKRSATPGPVVGITAAIHGNELNGIPVIHRIARSQQVAELRRGTVVLVPILNVPGYLRNQREFHDGVDLNRIMPGRPQGTSAQIYAHELMERVVSCFEYLIDLHTASFGRANAFYVRADMTAPVTAHMARLARPQIIVNNTGGDGTLRSAAAARGIHAITVEVGDPQRFQHGLIRNSRLGIVEVLEHLGMVPDIEDPDAAETVECKRSYWTYTDAGGLLDVSPQVCDRVKQGDPVAELCDVWGDVKVVYRAPEDGIIIGKSTNPVAHTGSRIVHVGVVGAAG
ncbi:MAG: succinylglutamate desuccinylase/aspartoacylase family protein [Polyangiaceae bacterium]|nr:succinylglutamate desuccinylase/aspartoacylase family protein [Polyangiaceae bacterium]